MGTVKIKDILQKASQLLQDTANKRWRLNELLSWLVDGENEILLHRPEANTQNTVIQLVPGTKQTVPTASRLFMGIVRNMGIDGQTPGRAVTAVEMETMDTHCPDWHTGTPSGTTDHYMQDVRDPRHFYVTPPQPDPPSFVEAIYSALPTLTPDKTPDEWAVDMSTITIQDSYANALLDYVLYRAYSKNSDATDASRAAAYYQTFARGIGIKTSTDRIAAVMHEKDKA